ncbi:MAG: ADP-ribosylglycohydrolase family protein [Chloroflexi bacterium]|nr:ADP-ribosylglycohydrolase family protein [Chloroflexota bacterium]
MAEVCKLTYPRNQGESKRSRTTLECFVGCLLGGAVGDALGAPVEFLSLASIRDRFGPTGIRDFAPAYGRVGAITDDTQMTMFTAEGLIRASHRLVEQGDSLAPSVIHRAYLRWLDTQSGRSRCPDTGLEDGWLIQIPALHSCRAAGNTCLSALRGGEMGTVDRPLNDSKGCGGVMRVAPVGLVTADPFRMGCEVAAITHGHPSGCLSAGFLASVISAIVNGDSLGSAIGSTRDTLLTWPSHEECLNAVDSAVRLASSASPTPETIERLGESWVGEEALTISLFCCLTAKDFETGVIMAVNHGGDSDSTGSIVGNVLGALCGKSAIPAKWLDRLELRDEIKELATDLYRHSRGGAGEHPTKAELDKYPGW